MSIAHSRFGRIAAAVALAGALAWGAAPVSVFAADPVTQPDAATEISSDTTVESQEPSTTPQVQDATKAEPASTPQQGAAQQSASTPQAAPASTQQAAPRAQQSATLAVTQNGAAVSTVHVGQQVTLTPQLSGYDTASVRFNYGWRFGNGWSWWYSTVKNTGSNTADASFSFTPSRAGTYTLFVDVISGSTTKTLTATLTVAEDWSFNGIGLSAGSINLGETVTVTPQTSGADAGIARFNYVWTYGDSWNEWSSTVKETGAQTRDASWTFKPSRAGTYNIYVDAVRTDGSLTTKQVKLKVVSNWSASSLAYSASGQNGATLVLGKPVDLTVTMGAGSNLTGLRYNFGWQRGNDWSDWDSLMKNGSASGSNAYRFTPVKTGTYHLFADVIGTDGAKRTVQTTVNVVMPYSFTGIQLSATSVTAGGSVTVTPTLSGDTAGVTYNYVWCHNGGWDDWSSTVLETGKNTSAATWTFTPRKSGTYVLYVDVVAPGGAVKQTLSTKVSVNRGWSFAGLSLDKASPQYAHTTVTVKPNVSGARTGELQYNYGWVRNNNWNEWWSTVKATGKRTTDTAYYFAPGADGTYTLFIDVYDTRTGEMETKQATMVINRRWTLKGLNISYGNPLRPNSSVTLTPVISGNTAGLTFNYVWQRDNWASWDSDARRGSYTTAGSKTVTIGGSGTYSFYVDVIDQYGEKQTAQVLNIRARYAAETINGIANTLAAESPLGDGWKYENALMSAGGSLCNGRHGWWCANYIWWGFQRNNALDLWGGGNHLNVDPEYLANEYRAMGRYSAGTAGVQRGDIIFSYWSPWRGGQNITHAAYVIGVTGSTITVLEGNMGRSAAAHTYLRSDGHFRGYARPAY